MVKSSRDSDNTGANITCPGHSANTSSSSRDIGPLTRTIRDGKDRGSEFGGCCHDEILKHWPDLAPLAALHLSDIDGAPMHAEANGWYWLSASMGGCGERYHGGTSKGHYGGEYREPTADECLKVFADHVRIPFEEAIALRALVISKAWNNPDKRTVWRGLCEEMRPRWKQEADAAIEQFGLLPVVRS